MVFISYNNRSIDPAIVLKRHLKGGAWARKLQTKPERDEQNDDRRMVFDKADITQDIVDVARNKAKLADSGIQSIQIKYCSGMHLRLLEPFVLSKMRSIDIQERRLTNDCLFSLTQGLIGDDGSSENPGATAAGAALRSLRIGAYHNLADSSSAWSALAEALSSTPTIEKLELDMYYCDSRLPDDHVCALLAAIAPTVKHVSLNNCQLSAKSMRIIASMTRLEHLELLHCIHDSQTLSAFASCMSGMAELRTLHVDNRSVAPGVEHAEVARVIANAMSDDGHDGTVRNSALVNVRISPMGDSSVANVNMDTIRFYATLNKLGFRGCEENHMTSSKWHETMQALMTPDRLMTSRVYYLLRYRPEWWSPSN